MVARARRRSSTDPLASPMEHDAPSGISTPPKPAVRTPASGGSRSARTPTSRQTKHGDSTSRKRAMSAMGKDDHDVDTPRKKARAPLAKHSPLPNEVVPPSAEKPARTGTSAKAQPSDASIGSTQKIYKRGRNVLAAEKRTPSAKQAPRVASSGPAQVASARTQSGQKMRNFDEAFDSAEDMSMDEGQAESSGQHKASNGVSREVFLSNETLRRQREARNFVYEGDENAPKLTRSGKVVGRRRAASETDDMDKYGAANGRDEEPIVTEDDGLMDDLVQPILAPDTNMPISSRETEIESVAPYPHGARAHLLRILSGLCGRDGGQRSSPLIEEEANEALQGLVNLLKGTVERGEGNSALLVGPRGSGKTKTISRALDLLPSSSKTSPIVVHLSGHAQVTDRLAIRELGRQISLAEGKKVPEEGEEEGEGGEDQEYAPTTLPSHLLALLIAPSPRPIIIIMEEFDLFTEHARQALLYCLLDVVQSVKTGPVETTGRGVAVIGLTSRIDTLLLLEKRVKSRFSHRVLRVVSPLSPSGAGWRQLLEWVLIPWKGTTRSQVSPELKTWMEDWEFALGMLLKDEKIVRYLNRLTGLTVDVRNLHRPFIQPLVRVLQHRSSYVNSPNLTKAVLAQIEGSGWGLQTTKLTGLSQPALVVLVIVKHLSYAGREEFNFTQVEEEYLRFARTRLVGSGRARWPIGVLRTGFDQLLRVSLLVPTGSSSLKPRFARVRCTLSPHEIISWFKGEGANSLGPELGNWGRTIGGHV